MEMISWPLLLVFTPLLGVVTLLLMPSDSGREAKNAKHVGLWTTGFSFVLSLIMATIFDPLQAGFQFQETWFPFLFKRNPHGCGVASFESLGLRVNIDGLSLAFILLTAFLFFLALWSSWKSVKVRVKHYVMAFLVLESALFAFFMAQNLLLFFILFEFVLVPMFFIVGIWGGENRLYAAIKFFVYTFAASLLLFVSVAYVYWKVGSFDMNVINPWRFNDTEQFWLALGFFIPFAVKVPMVPVHTWLPDTHVQAPTAGSVILAGILLKLGGYGILRFLLPVFPSGVVALQPFVYALSVIAIIYASLVAFSQQDIKKLVAYSSIAHMGIVTIGLFLMTTEGVQGAIFQMISHGVISGGLFLVIGMLYERLHTRDRDAFGGVAATMPFFATAFLVLTLGSLGLPGTMGFVGEIMVLLSLFQENMVWGALAATGALWSAMYSLWLYRKIVWEVPSSDKVKHLGEIVWRERLILAPLAFLVILFGVWPQPILKMVQSTDVKAIVRGRAEAFKARAAAVRHDMARSAERGWRPDVSH